MNTKFNLEELERESRRIVIIDYTFQDPDSGHLPGLDTLARALEVLYEKGYKIISNQLVVEQEGYSAHGLVILERKAS